MVAIDCKSYFPVSEYIVILYVMHLFTVIAKSYGEKINNLCQ